MCCINVAQVNFCNRCRSDNTNHPVVQFHSQRGTTVQWVHDGKYAVKWIRLSCRNFRATGRGFNYSR